MMYSKSELEKLVNAYGKLSNEDQIKEAELKLKSLVRSLRLINHEEELDAPTAEFEKQGLSETFYLLYCLEDEIAKILDR